jgi:alpha-L-rhamnosidase
MELGATTTREKWDTGGSHNHPMFGGGLVWYYRKLAGINADPEEPGYKHIIFRPMPAGDINYTKYINETSYGKAGIIWKKKGEIFSMEVIVPVGCMATVYVPFKEGEKIMENGKPVSRSSKIKILEKENGYQKLSVASGNYQFTLNKVKE